MSQRGPRKVGIGSSFDDFLKEQGTFEPIQEVAVKRVLAWKIAEAMREQKLTKTEMARRMETSRSQLDRLLDPKGNSLTLDTLARAARVIGRRLRIELV